MRIGSKGALVIQTSGPKRGSWFSHEANIGGGPIELIQHLNGCTLEKAIETASQMTGLAPWPDDAPSKNDQHDPSEAWRAAKVAQLWRGAVPLAGTLGERYLTDTRRIPKPATGWPQAVKYHPSMNAVIVSATTSDGAVQAVQVIRLDREGRKAAATPDKPSKQTFGHLEGAAVRLPGKSGPILFAEGPETGLSVWAATGYETRIALGSIAKLTAPADRKLVICRDDDKPHSPADKALHRAAKTWRQAGHSVAIATPWKQRAHDKSDFNDAIQAQGAAAVAARIETAINPVQQIKTRFPIDEARTQLDSVIARFFDSAILHEESEPPVQAIRAEVGIGKSEAARRYAAAMLSKLRQGGDKRGIVFAVPTHRLGDEQAKAFEKLPEARAAGLRAKVWRGREAADPEGVNIQMCRNLNAVKDAQEIGLDPQTTTCMAKVMQGGEAVTIKCPFYNSCGYQRQRASRADLWIVPHEVLFTKKPAALGDVAAVVVDESAWQDSLIGVHGRPMQLNLEALQSADPIGSPDSADTHRLAHLRGELYRAIQHASDGPIEREMLLVAGFTEAMAREAITSEWMRRIDAKITPNMTAEQRKEVKASASSNKSLGRFNTMWRGVAHLLSEGAPIASGWIELARENTEQGTSRVLRLKGRREIAQGFRVPTLIIDATLQLDLIKPIWPGVTLVADIATTAPHQHVWQVTDRSYSKRSLVQRDDVPVSDQTYRRNNLERLKAQIAGMAYRYAPGRVLVVAQQDTEVALQQDSTLPANVDLAHHNAIAGRDEWRDVAALIVVGRTQAPPQAVTRIAEALTGSFIPLLDSWYGKADAARYTIQGEAISTEADHHPDPIAEAVRWQICEGELIQIIGRGRGVNRTAENPLDVLVMTDAPLPIQLEAVVTARDIAPPPHAQQLAAGGITFDSPTAASTAYPEIWATPSAAKESRARARWDTFPYYINIYGKLTDLPLNRVTYQIEGAGRGQAVAWYDPAIIQDPVEWIAERIGPVKAAVIDTPHRVQPVERKVAQLAPPEPELDPAMIYRAAMIDQPPASSWRIKAGHYLVEKRSAEIAMVDQSAVSVSWRDYEACLTTEDEPGRDLAAHVIAWGQAVPVTGWGAPLRYARDTMARIGASRCKTVRTSLNEARLNFGAGF
ncbi:MAG: hypothetical protein B7Z77_08495 [Acidocella sp. 20-58-15]|nr:MAG: hypothetical protein B7Z77_08495 [Acidocella sp. 20-58-15]